MTKSKKLTALITSLLISSCTNLTPDQINSISTILKTSSSPSVSSTVTITPTAQKISLDGTVYDFNSNTRLSGVTIKINGQSVTTDSLGHYTLDILSGTASIDVSKSGYNNLIETHELKNKAETINFTLKPQVTIITPNTQPTITTIANNNPTIPTKTSFSGYIREGGTDKPLANTALKIGNISSITNDKGYFNFPDVPTNSTILLEYLNGLDKEPTQKQISLVSGDNQLILYYATIANPQPITTITSTPTPIINTPIPTPLPTSTPTSTPNISALPVLDPNTALPKSVFKNREGLTGIWEFTFTAKQGTATYKSIFAFMPSPISSAAFYAEEVLDEDKSAAINGKIRESYFNYTVDNSFLFKGLWDDFTDNQFFMTYKYYDNPVLQTGLYLSLIEPLIAIDKNTLIGIDSRITNGNHSSYNIVAKRLRDNFSIVGSNGYVSEPYIAKYN